MTEKQYQETLDGLLKYLNRMVQDGTNSKYYTEDYAGPITKMTDTITRFAQIPKRYRRK